MKLNCHDFDTKIWRCHQHACRVLTLFVTRGLQARGCSVPVRYSIQRCAWREFLDVVAVESVHVYIQVVIIYASSKTVSSFPSMAHSLVRCGSSRDIHQNTGESMLMLMGGVGMQAANLPSTCGYWRAQAVFTPIRKLDHSSLVVGKLLSIGIQSRSETKVHPRAGLWTFLTEDHKLWDAYRLQHATDCSWMRQESKFSSPVWRLATADPSPSTFRAHPSSSVGGFTLGIRARLVTKGIYII